MRSLQKIYWSGRYLGWGWLGFRLFYGVKNRLRLDSKRLKQADRAGSWEHLDVVKLGEKELPTLDLEGFPQVPPSSLFEQWDIQRGNIAEREAEGLLNGQLTYFSAKSCIVGSPPQWHRNAITGEVAPSDVLWRAINEFAYGDIKVIWEPSRFGWVYSLSRAYARSQDTRYANLFWEWLESWAQHNTPGRGVNWKCGQEASFRAMALVFGAHVFRSHAAATPRRMSLLLKILLYTGLRVEDNIAYAMSQRNNHGISEGMALWMLGLVLPSSRHAERWREKGRQVLERSAEELIYADGSFSQHSVNYHRVMLDDYTWALSLAQWKENLLTPKLHGRVERAALWLSEMIGNTDTGEAWCCGQNDGAHVLPLDNTAYQDYRGAVQRSWYVLHHERFYPSGSYDEGLVWLGGVEALRCPDRSQHTRSTKLFPEGGYLRLEGFEGRAFLHLGTLRDRPSQADLLHFDVWWKGHNVARDPGTFSYNAKEPWDNPLAHTRYHNTVDVELGDQMERFGKFLWLPWVKVDLEKTRQSLKQGLQYVRAIHKGFERWKVRVRHQREVLRWKDDWIIIDRVKGIEPFRACLHWLLDDVSYKETADGVVLHYPEGDYSITTWCSIEGEERDVERASRHSPRGWYAPCYSDRQPALSFASRANGLGWFWVTCMGPSAFRCVNGNSEIVLESQDQTCLRLHQDQHAVHSIRIENAAGRVTSQWAVN